jgi:hypothetical protein
MSSLNIPHSISLLSTNGDVDSGQGQLGYTAIGSLVGLINDLWTLTTPYKPHYCVLNCIANSALQLPIIGLGGANVGHRITIHNTSVANNIDVQTSTSASIYIIPFSEVSTFTAVSAPNGWDYTTQSSLVSVATLQSAYDAGNIINESLNREVLISDNAGFNQTILRIQASDTRPLLDIGNSLPGTNSPYIKQGYGTLNNPQSNTIYNISDGPSTYTSSSDDQNRQVSFNQTSKREVYGLSGIGLGDAGSSVVKDTNGASQIPINSVGLSSFNFTGLPNTTYIVKYDIIIRNDDAFSTIQVVFTMDNKALTNTVSSPYQEIQNSASVTVDPIITIVSFGTSGYTISIQGPDYNPPGPKLYTANWIYTHMAYTH